VPEFAFDPFIRARILKMPVGKRGIDVTAWPRRWVYEVYDSAKPWREATLAMGVRDSWQEAFDAARFDLITQLVDGANANDYKTTHQHRPH
jgi:hypothetical protein